MEMLYDSVSVLEALYDLNLNRQEVAEELAVMKHNYAKYGDYEILSEGVSDIIGLIISGIKAFIKKVRDLIKRIFMTMNSYTMEYTKLVEKYGDILLSADDMKPFTIEEGFDFTVLSKDRPDISGIYKIVDEFNADIVRFSSMSSSEVRELSSEICSEVYFERLRADILGEKNRIPSEEFRNTVHNFYRNGYEFPHEIKVDKQYVDVVVKESGALATEKRISSSEKDKTLILLGNIEKFFSVKVSSLYDDINKTYNMRTMSASGEASSDTVTIAETEMSKLVSYTTARYQQSVELTNIISVIFVERLSAINDQMNQNAQVIRNALRRIHPVAMEGTVERMMENMNSYPPSPDKNLSAIWEGLGTLGGDES